ncbi:MAG: hypothetical protein ACREF3_16405, partial [Acetobacteraceae bacterium]
MACQTCHASRDRATVASAARPAIIVLISATLYLLNVSYNLHCFYVRGAGDDSGWFAWLASNARSWPMRNPDVIGGNYLSIHMSTIFFVSSVLLQPLSDLPVAVRFCFFISLWAPLLWLAVFLLLDRFAAATFSLRIAVSLLLTFNGLALSMLGFPHIEILIPALGLLAIAIWLRAETPAGWAGAWIVILLALTVREDAGLHLFLTLVALASASAWVRDRRTMQRSLALAAVCVTGGILALLVQRLAVPGGGQQLGNVYLGHPAFSHVSIAGLGRRLAYWATRREYIFLPLLALMVLGFSSSANRLLLLGVAMSLPWLALS